MLDEALEAVVEGARLEVAAAFTVELDVLTLVAERGIAGSNTGRIGTASSLRDALTAIAERVRTSRKYFRASDLSNTDLAPDAQAALLTDGWCSCAAQPIKHQREVLGVLVFLATHPAAFDPAAIALIETVGHMLALALDRDRRAERETEYRDELARASLLATVGAVSASIADELSNKLGTVSRQLGDQARIVGDLRENATDWTRPMLAELSERLTDMTSASDQMTALFAQLNLLHRRDSVAELLDVSAAARDGLALVRRDVMRRGVRLVEEYAEDCLVNARRENVLRALLIVVINALEACTSGARDEPTICVCIRAEAGRVVVSVDDNAKGKRAQRSGLGMHGALAMISAEHGAVQTVDGASTSFRFSFSRVEGHRPGPHAADAPRLNPPGDDEIRRILMVDDDDVFTRGLKRALAPDDVRSASTASEAEMILLDPSYAPHVVLCNVGLPGLTGDILHARIASKRPLNAHRFVFVTGGTCSASEARYLRDSGCATLRKPFTSDEIWRAAASSRLSQRPSTASDPAAPTAPPSAEWPDLEGQHDDGYSDAPTLPPEMMDP